jgi:hypothetical protein
LRNFTGFTRFSSVSSLDAPEPPRGWQAPQIF